MNLYQALKDTVNESSLSDSNKGFVMRFTERLENDNKEKKQNYNTN